MNPSGGDTGQKPLGEELKNVRKSIKLTLMEVGFEYNLNENKASPEVRHEIENVDKVFLCEMKKILCSRHNVH